MVKNFFLISNLNLPPFSLEPFPLVLSLQTLVKSPCRPLQLLEGLIHQCAHGCVETGRARTHQRSPAFPAPGREVR